MELVHIQASDFETWCANQFQGLSLIQQQTKDFHTQNKNHIYKCELNISTRMCHHAKMKYNQGHAQTFSPLLAPFVVIISFITTP